MKRREKERKRKIVRKTGKKKKKLKYVACSKDLKFSRGTRIQLKIIGVGEEIKL